MSGCKAVFVSLAVLVATSAGVATTSPVISDSSAARDQARAQGGMILEGMNNQGWIAGRWTDAAGNSHFFLANPFRQTFSVIPDSKANLWSARATSF